MPPRTKPKRMDLVASVSRSSGLEAGGDALKDHNLQKEYRRFLQEKLDKLLHDQGVETCADTNRRVADQENLLILFRKLREGIVASARSDRFAVEVYETSLYLSILFGLPHHSTPVISHIVELYLKVPECQADAIHVLVLCLLHHLVSTFPSQLGYRQFRTTIPAKLFPRPSQLVGWLTSLAASIRICNYTKTELLSRHATVSKLFTVDNLLAKKALSMMVGRLRAKTRDMAWNIIRSAYREVACQKESTDTRTWLSRSLSFDGDHGDANLDKWLSEQSALGSVRRKEEIPGRWILVKVR